MKQQAEIVTCDNCGKNETRTFKRKNVPEGLNNYQRERLLEFIFDFPKIDVDPCETWLSLDALKLTRINPKFDLYTDDVKTRYERRYSFCTDECFLAWIGQRLIESKAKSSENTDIPATEDNSVTCDPSERVKSA